MGGYADWERLLPEDRVVVIERALRRAFPKLPDDAKLLTMIQPECDVVHQGKDVHVLPQAVFAILSPNPRRPDENKLTQGVIDMRVWAKMDKDYKRMVGFRDPALSAFLRIAPSHIDTIENLSTLMDPDPKLMH